MLSEKNLAKKVYCKKFSKKRIKVHRNFLKLLLVLSSEETLSLQLAVFQLVDITRTVWWISALCLSLSLLQTLLRVSMSVNGRAIRNIQSRKERIRYLLCNHESVALSVTCWQKLQSHLSVGNISCNWPKVLS